MENQIGKKNQVLNVVNSVEEEYKFLKAYYDEFYDMSYKVVKEYMDEVNRNTEYRDFMDSSESMFSDLQHYLLLANPEITLICEQYNQFISVERLFEELQNEANSLNEFPQLSKRSALIKEEIDNYKKYFEQFRELYEKHIENWQLLVDINTTEQKFGYWAFFTSGMELYQDKVKLILSPRIFSLLDKMQKKLVTVDDLSCSQDYWEIKNFIEDVRANKDFLMKSVAESLRLHFPELNKKHSAKLTDVHKVYIDTVNDLYEKKYLEIPRRNNLQSSLLYLEEAIKMLKQDYKELMN